MQIELSEKDLKSIAGMVTRNIMERSLLPVVLDEMNRQLLERSRGIIDTVVNEKYSRMDAWDQFVADGLRDVSQKQLKQYVSDAISEIVTEQGLEEVIAKGVLAHAQEYRSRVLRAAQSWGDDE